MLPFTRWIVPVLSDVLHIFITKYRTTMTELLTFYIFSAGESVRSVLPGPPRHRGGDGHSILLPQGPPHFHIRAGSSFSLYISISVHPPTLPPFIKFHISYYLSCRSGLII
jgi:hypothetical protein